MRHWVYKISASQFSKKIPLDINIQICTLSSESWFCRSVLSFYVKLRILLQGQTQKDNLDLGSWVCSLGPGLKWGVK